MADNTIQQGGLHIVRARHAHEPFRICQLCRDILHPMKLEIGGHRLMRCNLDRFGIIQFVSDRTDFQRVVPWLQPFLRECVMTLRIADHGDRDNGIITLGTDQYALHGTFRRGGYLASERCRRIFRRFLAERYCCVNQNGEETRYRCE